MRAITAAVSLVALATVGAAAITGCAGGPGVPTARRSAPSSDGVLDGSGAPAAALAPGDASARGSSATRMQVTIRSGPDTGTHAATSQEATCSYGLAAEGNDGSDAFANQFSDDSSAGLSALQVIVPDTRGAIASGSDQFSLSVRVGKPSKGHTYLVDTLPTQDVQRSPAGHGTVRIEDWGSTGMVTIDGQSADGTALTVTIECDKVLGGDGMPRH